MRSINVIEQLLDLIAATPSGRLLIAIIIIIWNSIGMAHLPAYGLKQPCCDLPFGLECASTNQRNRPGARTCTLWHEWLSQGKSIGCTLKTLDFQLVRYRLLPSTLGLLCTKGSGRGKTAYTRLMKRLQFDTSDCNSFDWFYTTPLRTFLTVSLSLFVSDQWNELVCVCVWSLCMCMCAFLCPLQDAAHDGKKHRCCVDVWCMCRIWRRRSFRWRKPISIESSDACFRFHSHYRRMVVGWVVAFLVCYRWSSFNTPTNPPRPGRIERGICYNIRCLCVRKRLRLMFDWLSFSLFLC